MLISLWSLGPFVICSLVLSFYNVVLFFPPSSHSHKLSVVRAIRLHGEVVRVQSQPPPSSSSVRPSVHPFSSRAPSAPRTYAPYIKHRSPALLTQWLDYLSRPPIEEPLFFPPPLRVGPPPLCHGCCRRRRRRSDNGPNRRQRQPAAGPVKPPPQHGSRCTIM